MKLFVAQSLTTWHSVWFACVSPCRSNLQGNAFYVSAEAGSKAPGAASMSYKTLPVAFSVCCVACLPVCLSACRLVCMFVCLSAYPPASLFVCLPTCLSACFCLSASLPACRSVCLSHISTSACQPLIYLLILPHTYSS